MKDIGERERLNATDSAAGLGNCQSRIPFLSPDSIVGLAGGAVEVLPAMRRRAHLSLV